MTHPDPTRPTSTTAPAIREHAAHPAATTTPSSRGAAYPAWLRPAAREANGLTGAHIADACRAAAVDVDAVGDADEARRGDPAVVSSN